MYGVNDTVFSGPAVTALGLAAARSVESGRSDRLIEDPLARRLFLAARRDLPMRLDWPDPDEAISTTEALHLHGSRYIGLRTRFYDDALTNAARKDVRQAVLLGAGLDTRAYRLPLRPDLHIFELDQPELLAWKRETIHTLGAEPQARVHDVGVDVRDNWISALRQQDFDPSARAIIIAEGLLPYLTPDEQIELLGDVTDIASAGSTFTADRIAGDPHANQRLDQLSQRSGINMRSLIAAGEAQLRSALTTLGWDTDEQPVTAIAALHNRDLSDPFAPQNAEASAEPPWLETTFITARRPTPVTETGGADHLR